MTADTSSKLLRYQAVLLAILDFQIHRNSGQFVCDGYDAVLDHYTRQKVQTENSFRLRRLTDIRRQLTALLKGVRSDTRDDIATFIQNKTGYTLTDLPEWQQHWQESNTKIPPTSSKGYTERTEVVKPDGSRLVRVSFSTGPRPDHLEEQEAWSPDGRLRVRVTQWRKGTNASTYVALIFPTASGAICGIPGIRPDIRAEWIDNTTVLITTNNLDGAHVRYQEVRSLGEIIRIQYAIS